MRYKRKMDERDVHQFRYLIKELSGEDPGKCIQCGKCSAGCPIAKEMDFLPNQVMELIRLNKQTQLLRANTFWLCAQCQTCSVRCPEDIDIAKVMNTLRRLCLKKAVEPGAADVALLNKVFVDSISSFGRVYELGMVMKYNILRGNPFKDITLAPLMIKKRKISFLPHKVKDIKRIKEMIKKTVG